MTRKQAHVWVVGYEQMLELVEAAVELGSSAPTDDYLTDYEGCGFLLVPSAQTTPTELLCAVIPFDADTGRWVRTGPKLPAELTVTQFLELIDGAKRAAAIRNPKPASEGGVSVVFIEVDIGTTHELQILDQPFPLSVARFLQREGLLYLARVMDDAGEPVSAELARRAAMEIPE